MSTAADFEDFARTFAENAADVFPRTCTVTRQNASAGTGGQRVQGARTNVYTNVPCLVEPIEKFGWKKDQADRILPSQKCNVFLPTRYSNAGTWTRITLDAKTDQLVVDAVELEPSFTLRPDTIPNELGVQYKLVATVEG